MAELEFARANIRVNAVCPGFIRTPMAERALDSGLLSEEQIIATEPIIRMGKRDRRGLRLGEHFQFCQHSGVFYCMKYKIVHR